MRCQNVYNIPASPLPPYSASRPRPAQSLVSSLRVMVSLLPLDIQYLAIGGEAGVSNISKDGAGLDTSHPPHV